jgi:hypothetical protein
MIAPNRLPFLVEIPLNVYEDDNDLLGVVHSEPDSTKFFALGHRFGAPAAASISVRRFSYPAADGLCSLALAPRTQSLGDAAFWQPHLDPA